MKPNAYYRSNMQPVYEMKLTVDVTNMMLTYVIAHMIGHRCVINQKNVRAELKQLLLTDGGINWQYRIDNDEIAEYWLEAEKMCKKMYPEFWVTMHKVEAPKA